jgi:putative membrane protein
VPVASYRFTGNRQLATITKLLSMLPASISKNDKKAYWLIGIFSVFVFAVISVLGRYKLEVEVGFDIHIFAMINAVINAITAVLLLAALWAVRSGKYLLHKKLMVTALVLSVLFLLSYIAHHLLAGEARFGDTNHDGIVTEDEIAVVGNSRIIYFIILSTHILLAGIILPFILFTAYRALTAEFDKHKKLSRITWPLWFYVAVTGPVVYLMISPYYS